MMLNLSHDSSLSKD
jgi:molecular chaperone GrpE (heat shock protein)